MVNIKINILRSTVSKIYKKKREYGYLVKIFFHYSICGLITCRLYFEFYYNISQLTIVTAVLLKKWGDKMDQSVLYLDHRLVNREIGSSFQAEERRFSAFLSVRTVPGTHPALWSRDDGSFFSGKKAGVWCC